MNKDFIVLENGFVIRKSYVNIILLAHNADDNRYLVNIHCPGGVITSYHCSEGDAKNELERITNQFLEEGE